MPSSARAKPSLSKSSSVTTASLASRKTNARVGLRWGHLLRKSVCFSMCAGSAYWGHFPAKSFAISTNGSIRSESTRQLACPCLSLPPPTLRERRHRDLSRRLVAVRRPAVLVLSEGERPQPRRRHSISRSRLYSPTTSSPGCGGQSLPQTHGSGRWDSFAVCRHRARNAGREGRLRAARPRPGMAGSKPLAHKAAGGILLPQALPRP